MTTTDDQLLEALGQAARRDEANDQLDALWDRHSAGELSEQELQRLIEKLPHGVDAAQIEASFRPFNDDFAEQLTERAAKALATPVADEVQAPVTELASRRRNLAMPMALAASLLVAVGGLLLTQTSQHFDAIPSYTASFQGGSEFRSTSSDQTVPVFQYGDRLELRLTPQTATDGEFDTHFYLSGAGQVVQLTDISVDLAASGAVRAVIQIEPHVVATPGDYLLIAAVGRAGATPSKAQLVKQLQSVHTSEGDGWQAWGFALLVSPE